jgi:GTPase SAR1 family protein
MASVDGFCPANRCTVIFVGRGRSGKTSLFNAMTNGPSGEPVSTIGMDAKPFSWVPFAVNGQGKLVAYKEPDRLLESCIAIAKHAQQVEMSDSVGSAVNGSEGETSSNSDRSTYPKRVRSIVNSFSPRSGYVTNNAQPKDTPTAGIVQYDKTYVVTYMDERKASGDGTAPPLVVFLLDLGGQDNFYPLHPYFFTRGGDGVVFLVFNMMHLHSTATAEEKAAALDYIKRWINAIMVGG